MCEKAVAVLVRYADPERVLATGQAVAQFAAAARETRRRAGLAGLAEAITERALS